MTLHQILAVAMLALLFLIVRIVWIYRRMQLTRAAPRGFEAVEPRKRPCKTLVILGSGGHTSEMLQMIRPLNSSRYNPLLFVVADTDHTSVQRLKATCNNDLQQPPPPEDHIYVIPRSREVGQSYVTSLWTTLYALMHAFGIVIRIRPELILCNGPGTCVPLVLAAWVLRIGGMVDCKFVFVESYCRVQTLSLTGKILYHGVDLFLVHWESLQLKYPKSLRTSAFVKLNTKSNHN